MYTTNVLKLTHFTYRQRELAIQKEELERQQIVLKNKSNTLQEEEKDIIQQREQLYRYDR